MTGFLCVKNRDAIHLMADGALYDAETHVIRRVQPKIVVLPEMGCAFVSRGNGALAYLVATFAFRRHKNFAAVIADLKALTTEVEAGLNQLGQPGLSDWELLVAGWLGDRPQVFFLKRNHDVRDDFDRFAAGPGMTVELVAALDPEHFEAVRDGLPLFELMRNTPEMDVDGSLRYGVGGMVTLASIYRDGIAHTVLKRWPEDVPGVRLGHQCASLAFAKRTARLAVS